MRAPVTAVVLTLNEEDRIGRCLTSLAEVVERVVLVDSLSKDSTLERARQAWQAAGRDARDLALVSRTWPGFTRARNESLDWVSSEWVLWLDADEWLGRPLLSFVAALGGESSRGVGLYRLPRQSYFMGRAIRHGGWFPDRKARLARARECRWTEGALGSGVHEDLELLNAELAVRDLPRELVIEHEPFRNRAEQDDTNRRYSALLASGLARAWADGRRRPIGRFEAVLKTGFKFFENFVWKLGFLDGWAGFVIAWGSARSMRLRLSEARRLLSAQTALKETEGKDA